jgi:hypothetical protein
MTPRSLHRRVPMSRLSIKNGWLALATGWIWSLKRGRCVQLLWSCAVVPRPKRSSPRLKQYGHFWTGRRCGVSSIQTDVAANSSGLVDGTCAALMPTISRQMRSLTYPGRSGMDYLPTAMAAARAAFEVGLRLAWINAPEDHEERKIRVLRLHNDQARWKNAVARDYDRSSAGGDRWRRAAQVQAALVGRELGNISWTGQLQQPPSVSAQLHELDLDRLYSGYRLASEYVHGGLSSALETEAVRSERSPFGIYWPNDWSLAVLMCAWGCRFSTRHYAGRGFNLGPLRGSMLAAELMLLSPGSGWRQNE